LEKKKDKRKNEKVKKKKKKKECTVGYYCNPQCNECGWIMNSPHSLAYYLIVIPNQLNIKKIKLTKIILEKKTKKTL
jgi:hypothetical protein